ncbi:hypothetical protein D9758_003242 [Tetrapyrgos nigripes]|uniref:MARVEL domain-containing protein n=1 Tax=Tetrapyrgos nigripes TaxID=182062 RepID=A0A8H5GIZ0_9AGAR|nr:hypothetical protein D9758_003242 [Tetrapyrgos nigripes]
MSDMSFLVRLTFQSTRLSAKLLEAILIICSSIIASLATWNLSLSSRSRISSLDPYLIFLGAAGLILAFTMIFIELAAHSEKIVTNKLWFECCWTGLLSVMELAGAASYSSIAPSQMCSTNDQQTSSCTSTRALMAFTWLCTITLLSYSFMICMSCVIYSIKDPRIWVTTIRDFSLFDSSRLNSQPPSPTPRATQKAPATPSIKAPQPRRPVPTPDFSGHHSGLSAEYEIEHFQPPPQSQYRSEVRSSQGPSSQPNTGYKSLYPQILYPPEMTHSNERATSFQSQKLSLVADSSPVIDWPRPDVLSQPISTMKARIHSQGSSQDPRNSNSLDAAQGQRSRPTGPRPRGGSDPSRRPPALDLSNISSYRERDRDNPH